MKIRHLHAWNVTYREAVQIQNGLRLQLVEKSLGPVGYVAGADVASAKKSQAVWAGIVVLSYPGLCKVDEAWAKGRADFPYIPGLLSFREIPFLLKALERIRIEPDLILCDGQGIAHPRGLGLAAHLGLLLTKTTVGCAKKRLVGKFSEVGPNRGDYSLLFHEDRPVGAAVRTRAGVKPLFVSPGYGITIDEAVATVLGCCGRYRIPEPIRQAHFLANGLRQREEAP